MRRGPLTGADVEQPATVRAPADMAAPRDQHAPRRGDVPVVSVALRTVRGMSKHICVYFDDGGLEPACVCGERLIVVVEEDGVEVVATLAADQPATIAA